MTALTVRTTSQISEGTGSANDSFDLSAFFLRGDTGYDFGATTLTYTVWHSSVDDNANDGDFDAFIATDVDINESMIFQENFTDDDYFAETTYLLDKGYLLNKVQVDHKLSSLLVAIYNALEEAAIQDGKADEDIVHIAGRVRYKF
jgi:hypothetical protein